MSDVGGAGDSGSCNGGSGGAAGVGGSDAAGKSSDVGGPNSCSGDKAASDSVDGAMSDVSHAEVGAAADSVAKSVDGYQGPSAAEKAATEQAAADEQAKQEKQEAGICIGTEDECAKQFAEQRQKEADRMTDEQAIKALDGSFLHDPRSLTPAQAKGLEALSKQESLHPDTRKAIESFLSDYRKGVDSLGFNGQLGRFNTYPTNPAAPLAQ